MDKIIRNAISQRKLLAFSYKNFPRVVEPYIFGTYKGKLQLLCFQVRGQSSSGKLPEWRRMNVGKITNLSMLEEPFVGQRPTKQISKSPFDLLIDCTPFSLRPKMLYLVSGVGKKHSHAAPAQDLYHSPWFHAARNYVEQKNAPWFILSTKHGLLSPDTRIAPYEKAPKNISFQHRIKWTERVFAALKPKIYPGDRIIIMAGISLRELLIKKLEKTGCEIDIPLKSLRIGEQLQWFKKRNLKTSVGKTFFLPLPSSPQKPLPLKEEVA